MKRKYLWHLTSGKNFNSIMKDGFIKSKLPIRSYIFPMSLFRPKGVYLTENPLHWTFIAGSNSILLKIDIKDLPIKKDNEFILDYFCESNISTDKIVEIMPLYQFIIDDKNKIKILYPSRQEIKYTIKNWSKKNECD